MPDNAEESSARPENNLSESQPSGDRPSWGSEDRLQNLANLLAVIVAVAAISLTVWQGYEQRRFYRLSIATWRS